MDFDAGFIGFYGTLYGVLWDFMGFCEILLITVSIGF